MHEVSGIIPGVMGQTGMETSEIIEGVVSVTKPDVVIAIDALAARSTKRLNRTIQITDTGIMPGSGVGNHRERTYRRKSECEGNWNWGSYCCGCSNNCS